MQIEHMQFIVKVADLGSINKASKCLYIHQQQLSKIIQNVEMEIDTVIFERTYKGIELTENGVKVIDIFRKILELYNSIASHSGNKEEKEVKEGQLFLQAYPGMWLEGNNNTMRIVNMFASQYPNIAISFNESQSEETVKILKENPNYIGIIVQPQNDIISAIEIPDDFLFIPVLKSKLAVYGAKNHPFMKRYQTTTIRALLNEPLVFYRASDDLNRCLAPLLGDSEKLFVKYTVSNIQSFYDILKKGKALTLGAYRKKDWHQNSELEMIPLRDNIYITTGLLIHCSMQDDVVAKAFCDFYIENSK